MKFSSEPPTAALFCGEIETSRSKFSSEIKNFDRDQKFRSGSNFLIVGPSGFWGGSGGSRQDSNPKTKTLVLVLAMGRVKGVLARSKLVPAPTEALTIWMESRKLTSTAIAYEYDFLTCPFVNDCVAFCELLRRL